MDARKDPEVNSALRTPDAAIYAIDVSFAMLEDKAEFAYLNELPTSFRLSGEAIDRLRDAAGKIIMASPDFKKLLRDASVRIAVDPSRTRTAIAVPDKKWHDYVEHGHMGTGSHASAHHKCFSESSN